MQLGLRDPVPGAIPLKLSTYMDYRKLPTPPRLFGSPLPVRKWGVLANNDVGDCAPAGACHQIMAWTVEANGHAAPFSDATALRNYSEIAGYDPNALPDRNGNNPTDQGTLLSDLAKHWATKGIVDAYGKRHRIKAFVEMDPGDTRELWVATWLFGSVGLGFDLPDSAIEQTKRGQDWEVVRGAQSLGGHFVPAFARTGPIGTGVTWGEPQAFTSRFYKKYNNQGLCVFSEDMLIKARKIDGLDDARLRDDLIQIGR